MAVKKWVLRETAEVLGVIGVVASLIFVALEIRQNTNAVLSATIQGVLDQSFAANLVPVDNASLREAIYSSPEELNDDQRRQLGWFYTGLLRVQLNRFSQSQVGILDEAAVLNLGARGGVFQTPSFESFWATQGGRYSPEFEAYINGIVNDPRVNMEWTNATDTD